MRSWFKARLGRMRVSTVALIVAFLALFWVHQTFQPKPAGNQAPAPAVVPPGFVPDPNYTWVPRSNVRRPTETLTTETTTPTTTTTSPTSAPPTTTVIDPDGPGPLPPITITLPPGILPSTTAGPTPAPTPTTPAPPR
jgi:cytoskeletal protein RodZ